MFDLMQREFLTMDRQFAEMDRQMQEFDTALARDLQRLQRPAEDYTSGARSSVRQEQLRPSPNVDIRRQEERGPGVYRYSERILITSGGSGGYFTGPPPAAVSLAAGPAPLPVPALLGVAVAVGGFVALTAAFNRNYQLTPYAEDRRWLLLALWPLLVAFSPKFREQFAAAVRGQRAGSKKDSAGGGGGGGIGGGDVRP